MVIKVHGIPLSTCTARVLLCLCEKGLQYKLVPVDVENSAHKKPPYLSLNVRLLTIGVDGSALWPDTGIRRWTCQDLW
ncbi:hypothetical protein PVK06_035984 [Gossypium arboreum]|uniref:glutathione transferase n=1 Tax=Gossypium arboreum TaxID=29729 RepID=A0ABR0NI97_GOSAR|nr:hypothetical protein PVK06_035984 [Gossypium arboreum]